MDDIVKGNSADVGRNDFDTPGTSGSSDFRTGALTGEWTSDRDFWRQGFSNRPYASADRGFDYYEPGYRFGYDAVNRYRGRNWNDVESNLRTDWDKFEGRGNSTWENMKDSVRDAWDNLTGKR